MPMYGIARIPELKNMCVGRTDGLTKVLLSRKQEELR